MTAIPLEEVAFHPHSFADPAGRLFAWEGELYRALGAETSGFYADLLGRETVRTLMERGRLVATRKTTLELPGYELVLAHDRVPFPSYPTEWCAPMLRDAALLVLDLVEELAAEGLTLKDAHPWNVLFNGCVPVFVDLTSIAPLAPGEGWVAEGEFRRFFLNTLLLMASGNDRIARALLPDYEGVTDSDVDLLLGRRPASRLRRAAARPFAGGRRRSESSALVSGVRDLRRRLEEIDLASTVAPRPAEPVPADREAALARLAADLEVTSVLDVEPGVLRPGVVSAPRIEAAVVFESDPAAAGRLYADARRTAPAVLPLRMDVCDPTPARGISEHWQIAAAQRLRCDLVLCLFPLRRLAQKRSLRLDQIADALAAFTGRRLVVEYVPPEDWATAPEARYSLDEAIEVFRRRFAGVSVISAGVGRSLLVCGS